MTADAGGPFGSIISGKECLNFFRIPTGQVDIRVVVSVGFAIRIVKKAGCPGPLVEHDESVIVVIVSRIKKLARVFFVRRQIHFAQTEALCSWPSLLPG